jgi:hypothetical protein
VEDLARTLEANVLMLVGDARLQGSGATLKNSSGAAG